MRSARWLVAAGLLPVAALVLLASGHYSSLSDSPIISALFGNWDFVKSVQQDKGVYFRLKVKLAYKGEPQDFDIVVACTARQINYASGGRTYEAGLVPSVFGRRMADGKGLIVRPPDACDGGTTENGDVAPDLLPLVVVYDDAETLAFGTAYLTDDAYDSPLSVLKFGGAVIERADLAAFEKFRSEQPNLITRSSYHTVGSAKGFRKLGLPPARIPMGIGCYGYVRFRLAEAEKEHAHKLWPIERPRFWTPVTNQDRDEIHPLRYGQLVLSDSPSAVPTPSDLVSILENGTANQGMPRRHPIGWGKGRRLVASSYYPDIGGWIALPWPADAAVRAETILRDGPHVEASIDFRDGAMRGFGYCRPEPINFPTGVEYPDPAHPPWFSWVRLPQIDFVDGIEIANRLTINSRPQLIVERDEFVFLPFSISLPSTWGDV